MVYRLSVVIPSARPIRGRLAAKKVEGGPRIGYRIISSAFKAADTAQMTGWCDGDGGHDKTKYGRVLHMWQAAFTRWVPAGVVEAGVEPSRRHQTIYILRSQPPIDQ